MQHNFLTQEVGDTHLEMLVSLLCFKTGATRDPTGPGGRVPEVQSVLPSLRDWHAGMLRVLANALDDRAMMSRLHRWCILCIHFTCSAHSGLQNIRLRYSGSWQ